MAWLETAGVKTWYEVTGKGPWLLLIPGRGLDRTSWAPQIPVYAEHFRVVSYDPRGVGKTQFKGGDFSVVEMAGDAAALLRALNATDAHVSGFSLGGMAAIHLAATVRLPLRSLMLHSTTHRAYPHMHWRQRLSLAILDKDDGELWALFSAFTAFGAEFINAHELVVQQEVDRRIARWARLSDVEKQGIKAQIRAAMSHDAAALLATIDIPTLVTVGSSDEVTRPEYAREIANGIAGARFVLFEGAPHRVSTFLPDEFNRVTLSFLLEQEAKRARPNQRTSA